MSLYPMPMQFPASLQHVEITVSPEGWTFAETSDRLVFESLPVSERLELRKQFEAQVALAKATPTRETA